MDFKKLVGSILLGLVTLSVVGMAISNSHRPQAAQSAPSVSQDKWQVKEERSQMDDSKTVELALESEDTVQGSVGASRPSLVILCQQDRTVVYVATGMAASVEVDGDGSPSASHSVGIRLDDEKPSYHSWVESGDHKALASGDMIFDRSGNVVSFSGGSIEFAKQIAGASKLTFQFTPFDGTPQIVRFDVRGLDSHLHKVAEACGWAYE